MLQLQLLQLQLQLRRLLLLVQDLLCSLTQPPHCRLLLRRKQALLLCRCV